MRPWFHALLVAAALIPSAYAFPFFPMNPLMVVRPDVITAQVYNPYYEPILCQGHVYGQVFSGLAANAYLGDVIAPGGSRWLTLTANPYTNPFVNGWSQMQCRFLRY